MAKKGKNLAVGAVFAAVAGFVAGILAAPKSGKETRADIKKAATMSVAEGEKQLKKLHTQLNNLMDTAKEKADTAKGKAKTEYDDALAKAKTAREKARQMLSAAHDGEAEDKELQKVIDDATSAIDHLKTFLKKSA